MIDLKLMIIGVVCLIFGTAAATIIYYYISEWHRKKRIIKDVEEMTDVELRRYIIQKIIERGYEVISDENAQDAPGTQSVDAVDYFGNIRNLYKPIYFREYK